MRTSVLLWVAAIEDAVALVADVVEAVAVAVDEVEGAVGEETLEAIDRAGCDGWLPSVAVGPSNPKAKYIHSEKSTVLPVVTSRPKPNIRSNIENWNLFAICDSIQYPYFRTLISR